MYQFSSGFCPSREQCRQIVCKMLELELDCGFIELKYDISGRPSIRNSEKFISYSHSSSLLVLALANNPVGVDTESCDRKSELFSLRNIAFSDNENVKMEDVLLVWCLKEAALKMIGKGFLDSDPNELSVSILADDNDEFVLSNNYSQIIAAGNYNSITYNGNIVVVCSGEVETVDEIKIMNKDAILCMC